MPCARAVDLSFVVYEMPRPTLEALTKYLDGGGDVAVAAYKQLAGMSGVTELSSLKVSTPSGKRTKVDSGRALVGDEAWMGVEGLNLELDPLVGKNGEVDMNLVLKFLHLEKGRISEYNLISAVMVPPDQPTALQVWNEGSEARVVLVTASDAGEFRPESVDGAMMRLEMEVVELGSSRAAQSLADQGDAQPVETARGEGTSRLHHVMHARSGSRMQSRAGSGTARQFPGEMEEYQLDLAPTLGADRSEVDLRVDLSNRRAGIENKIGSAERALAVDGAERIFALKNPTGGVTPFVVIVRTSLFHAGRADPKVTKAKGGGTVPKSAAGSAAKDPAALTVEVYPLAASFMRDKTNKYLKEREQLPAAKDLLSAAGMDFPPGSSAFFNPSKCTMVLRQNAAGHEKMEALIGE